MTSIEDTFNREYDAWRDHCRSNTHHSFAGPYINCEPFRRIIGLGPSALPFIRNAYATEQGNLGDPYILWPFAIRQIIPEFKLPVNKEGSFEAIEQRGGFIAMDVHKVRQATLDWLDDYLALNPTPA